MLYWQRVLNKIFDPKSLFGSLTFTPLDLITNKETEMKFYVYVLISERDGLFYTGYTSDIMSRLNEHNSGKVSSTKNRKPFILIYWEGCLDQQDATRREKYLKSGNGKIYIRNRLRNYLQNPTG